MTVSLRHIPAAEGRPVLDGRLLLKIAASETEEAYTFLCGHTPPGLGPPLHNHELEDETFYVLRGTYEMQCGPAVIRAEEGAAFHMPRYTPHTFRNVGDGPGELVELMTPGGLDRYFDAVGHLGPEATDLDARTAIGKAFGISFPTDPDTVIDPPAGGLRRPITHVPPGDGPRIDVGGCEAVVKVASADADGLHSLVEVDVPAGGRLAVPPASQSLLVTVSGTLTVEAGADAVEMEAGDSVTVRGGGDVLAMTDGRPARVLLFSLGPDLV